MDQEQLLRMERLVSDLIKFIAQSHVKLCSYEEQIYQLKQQMLSFEEYVLVLLEKENTHHNPLVPSQSYLLPHSTKDN
ncbi:hypothetical protein [Bacillus massiliigorillae]|uniref:hypothetical protein n=1 Tax=Bacillus massiliigorillae TaxID=1243664 RepID=UPI0003A22F08|nr:hypothetical protein [Bacillus massiliigorillae]